MKVKEIGVGDVIDQLLMMCMMVTHTKNISTQMDTSRDHLKTAPMNCTFLCKHSWCKHLKSSKFGVWSIYAVINELPPDHR